MMSAADDPQPWSADWAAVARDQRRAWARSSAEDRLSWLEDALTFAAEVGALAHDRRARAAAAQRWDAGSVPTAGSL
jgi:hypothetical protein